MQKFIHQSKDFRRITRWGDEQSVRRSVSSKYARLTGLPTESLIAACPFWEARTEQIKNYGSRVELTLTGSFEMTSRGLKRTSGNISIPGINMNKYAVVFLNIVSDTYNIIELLHCENAATDVYRTLKYNSGSVGGPVILYFNITNYFLNDAAQAETYIRATSSNESFVVNGAVSVGVLEFGGAQRIATFRKNINADGALSYTVPDGNLLLFNDSDSSFECGGCFVIDLDGLSANVGYKALDLLVSRGWEVFEPTSFANYYLGATEVDDVEIIYDPDAEEAFSLSATASLYHKLLMGLCLSETFESVGSITADQWLEILFTATAQEATGDITFSGVFVEVLQDGTLTASSEITGEVTAELFFTATLEVFGEILADVGCGREITMTAFNTVGDLVADQSIGLDFTMTAFDANSELLGTAMISVNQDGLLLAESSLEAVMVPEGSVFINWIVGEGVSSLEGIPITSVEYEGILSADGELTAECLAQYSLQVLSSLLTSYPTIQGTAQVTNLPATGNLRKTDLIKVMYNTDLISKRR